MSRFEKLFSAIETICDDIKAELPCVGQEVRFQGVRAIVVQIDSDDDIEMIQLEFLESNGGWKPGDRYWCGSRSADQYLHQ